MKILVAYDGSTCADAAIADLRNAGLPKQNEVLVVTVAHDGWPPSKHSTAELGEFGNPWNALMADTGSIAAKAAARIQTEFPAWKVSSEALWGHPADIIKKTIDHWAPDLLVVGSHGRSAAGRLLLGSVSFDLVHHAPCAVRVVRTGTGNYIGPLRVLVANDGSPHAENALGAVARRCWPVGTQVRVVSVVQTLVPPVPTLVPALEGNTFATEPAYQVIEDADKREHERLHKVAENAGLNFQRAGLDASAVVLEGLPWKELVGEAERWHANAIFVGARGPGPMDRLMLGSVSTAVLTHAHCSVEVVRMRQEASQSEVIDPRYEAARSWHPQTASVFTGTSAPALRLCARRSPRILLGGTSWAEPAAPITVVKRSSTCGAAFGTSEAANPGSRTPW